MRGAIDVIVRRVCTGLAGSLLCALTWAQAEGPSGSSNTYVENCIGVETIELHAGEDSALLDPADSARAFAAMLKRYPMLERDGFAPTAIVLWRKPESGWVYLALNSHPDKPGKVCSAATFSAGVFEFSATLLRKYFFASPRTGDDN